MWECQKLYDNTTTKENKWDGFSNPKCPQCGVETTVSKEWDSYFYECRPCRRKATREYEEKQKLKQRLSELEENSMVQISRNGKGIKMTKEQNELLLRIVESTQYPQDPLDILKSMEEEIKRKRIEIKRLEEEIKGQLKYIDERKYESSMLKDIIKDLEKGIK